MEASSLDKMFSKLKKTPLSWLQLFLKVILYILVSVSWWMQGTKGRPPLTVSKEFPISSLLPIIRIYLTFRNTRLVEKMSMKGCRIYFRVSCKELFWHLWQTERLPHTAFPLSLYSFLLVNHSLVLVVLFPLNSLLVWVLILEDTSISTPMYCQHTNPCFCFFWILQEK